MGFKPYNLVKRLFKRKTLSIIDYQTLNLEDKEFIDYTIEHNLKPNYILILKGKKLKPKKIDFWKLSWNDIILIRHYLECENIQELLYLLYSVKPKDFIKLEMLNTMSVYKWIANQIKIIKETESNELGGEPSIEEINAGVEKLDEFGYAVSLDTLSKGNILSEEEILEKPYSVIFRKLCLNKVKGDIQKDFMENASRKNRRNS